MDIWSWICDLPNSTNWSESDSPPIFNLIPTNNKASSKSILLKAERTSGSNFGTLVTFSICITGFDPSNTYKTLWVSDACPLSSDQPFLPLLLQLIHETITRSPSSTITCPPTHFPKPKPEPVLWILTTYSTQSFSTFFNVIFLCRLFWLCVFDAPNKLGAVYFKTLLGTYLDPGACKHVLNTFLSSVGIDAELCVMRTLGYMLVKWLMVRELRGVGLQQVLTMVPFNGFSYAMEAHGMWILKGYNPLLAMTRTLFSGAKGFEVNEAVLKYALAHQQLEVVIQLEYSISFFDGFIQVKARVDNLRFHVVKLGFNKDENDEGEYSKERYFPSRIRVWVGPEIGSTCVSGLSLGRSTENLEKEVETQNIVKGNFGKSKVATVKAKSRTTTKTNTKNWRWEQNAEGNLAIFDGILYDDVSGVEVATWKGGNHGGGAKSGFRKRYSSANRAFNRMGGLVLVGDDCGEGVVWRVNKEMEGSLLKWRLGGKIWLSYWPNEVKSTYFETRCVEWCEEVDLPLIVNK